MKSRGTSRAPAPQDVEEALALARRHALAALAESALAARALVDAASLATTGGRGEAHAWLGRATGWLDAAAEQARAGADLPLTSWLDGVSDALDDEIERWESRARHDPEARAVLRAFLGVREILWDFGLRATAKSDAAREHAAATESARPGNATPASESRARPPRSVRRGPTRLERVPVEG